MTTPIEPAAPQPGVTAPPASSGQVPDAATQQAARVAIGKARGALARYRVMAIVTGVMLLLLCVELIVVYVIGGAAGVDVSGVKPFIRWIPFAHGWVYVVYLVTVVDLWSKMRWSFGRLVAMVLAGVVPVMSFVLEKRVHADAEAKLDGLAEQYGV